MQLADHHITFGHMNFSAELIQWYLKNKRDLPWRNTTDAYVIWLSEIILQQTRVDQGLPYFYRFIEKYPDVRSFAAADEDEILNLWQGLGYYSRGRNMLKTARQVAEQYKGKFPETYEQLIKLKGIGDYTAAAISSFAVNEARAVVDGNVFRVLARYFGIAEPINSTRAKKLFQDAANELLDKNAPGLHNQAIMEFGAMLCKPKNPDCIKCPLSAGCYAYNNKQVAFLPQKLQKTRIRERFFNYLLITDGDTVLMNKRGDKDIWANMIDLPLIETTAYLLPDKIVTLPQINDIFESDIQILKTFSAKKHLLTHQHIYTQFIHIENRPVNLKEGWFYAEVNNLKRLAFPKIIAIFINNFFSL